MADTDQDRDSVRAKLISLFPRLRRFSAVLSGDRGEAEALLRSACRKMLEDPKGYQRGIPFDRWAFREMHNEWLAQLRAHKEPILHGRADPAVFLPGNLPGDETSHYKEIADILAKLPPQQRSAVLLIYGEGFSYDEAAEILDTPAQTIIARVSRALASFIERADWMVGAGAKGAKVEPFAQRNRRAS